MDDLPGTAKGPLHGADRICMSGSDMQAETERSQRCMGFKIIPIVKVKQGVKQQSAEQGLSYALKP